LLDFSQQGKVETVDDVIFVKKWLEFIEFPSWEKPRIPHSLLWG